MQAIVEKLDSLRPESRHCRHLAELARQFSLQCLQQLELAGGGDLSDLARQILANARQLREILLSGDERSDALGQRLNRPCRLSVSTGAKWIAPLDLQQVRHLIEHGRDLGILDRHQF